MNFKGRRRREKMAPAAEAKSSSRRHRAKPFSAAPPAAHRDTGADGRNGSLSKIRNAKQSLCAHAKRDAYCARCNAANYAAAD